WDDYENSYQITAASFMAVTDVIKSSDFVQQEAAVTGADWSDERVNDYQAVRMSLASPQDIRAWSFGEVKNPQTIDAAGRPVPDGLFCERIFGPQRDWECACGKYQDPSFAGTVCERCGVTITKSRVRRKRMGHIELATPVVHTLFVRDVCDAP